MRLKRLTGLLLCLCVMFTVLTAGADAAVIVANGSCGERLTWKLDAEGTLTIRGTGAMTDFSAERPAPWYPVRTELRSVVIEEGVTGVGAYAFIGCEALRSAVLPVGVTSVGDYAFFTCVSLTDIRLPAGLTKLGEAAFGLCAALTELEIPEGVTELSDGLFAFCGKLTDVTVPESVRSVGALSFGFCGSLCGISLPDGVAVVGAQAFSGCGRLTELVLPESTAAIGAGAFSGCAGLKRVDIPAGVTAIGESAFDGCEKLTELRYSGSEAEWESVGIGAGNESLTAAEPCFPEKCLAPEQSGSGVVPRVLSFADSVFLSLENTAQEEKTAKVLAACYDEDGRFISLRLLTAELASGERKRIPLDRDGVLRFDAASAKLITAEGSGFTTSCSALELW